MQIQDFYNYLLDNDISGTTVHRYHAIIRKSLNYAVKMDMIISNPALKVDLPKKISLFLLFTLRMNLNNY